jgi:hypothetical protein
MDITNSDDLREKIHEIHNYMRNNGIGYGLTSLKVFNLFYGLMKIEDYGLNEKIAIYMDTILSGLNKDKMRIVTINRKDKKNIMSSIEIVDSASLSYINEDIKQTFKPNLKLADDDLIETYTIDF